MFRILLTTVLLISLTSCGEATDTQQENSNTPGKAETPTQTTTTEAQERPELDLSLPENSEQLSGEDLNFEKTKPLPDFFEENEEKQKKKMSLGANLLNDPANENYVESVKGAEIKVEIQN